MKTIEFHDRHLVFPCRNGRWRSQWSVTFQADQSSADVVGIMKVQVILFIDVFLFYAHLYSTTSSRSALWPCVPGFELGT